MASRATDTSTRTASVQNNLDITQVCDYDGRTPLHLAASEGALSTAEWLLAQSVNVDAVDRFGRTPLMDALMGEHAIIGQMLLKVCAAVFLPSCTPSLQLKLCAWPCLLDETVPSRAVAYDFV